jgi:hypothetical protein
MSSRMETSTSRGTSRDKPSGGSPSKSTEHQNPTNTNRDHIRQFFLDQQLTLDRQRAEFGQPTEAVENLLRCQREYFDQLEHPDLTQDVHGRLDLALRMTGTGPIEAKRMIRKWALHHHITEVLQKVRDPAQRQKVLHEQRTALVMFPHDDGGDNMWILEGFKLFCAVIDKVGLELAALDAAQSQRERRRVAAGRREVPGAGQSAASITQGMAAGSTQKSAPSTTQGTAASSTQGRTVGSIQRGSASATQGSAASRLQGRMTPERITTRTDSGGRGPRT